MWLWSMSSPSISVEGGGADNNDSGMDGFGFHTMLAAGFGGDDFGSVENVFQA